MEGHQRHQRLYPSGVVGHLRFSLQVSGVGRSCEKIGEVEKVNAATEWMRFDPDSAAVLLGTPQPGEWCLWSFVTKYGREYYSGSWHEHDGKKMIRTEYGWSVELKDAYFARVNKLPFDLEREKQT